jgi:ESCRT-II complex subunit VPS36
LISQAREVLQPTKTIGINGLERASAALRLQNDAVLYSSFQDLEALMARAKDLIALAEQFASKLSSLPASTSSDARLALKESSELLGLSTPIVTKEIAGGQDAYWAELARQIAEFLTSTDSRGDSKESILKREGGIIPLIDLFAIYNRARGVGIRPYMFKVDLALVSPTDLAKACAMFPKMRLPVRLKTFKSGLVVVQDSSASDEVVERNLLRFITGTQKGVTALEIGGRFNWSVGVAMELLQVLHSLTLVNRRLRKRMAFCAGMLLLKEYGFGRIDLFRKI